jgi:hypothetical protein
MFSNVNQAYILVVAPPRVTLFKLIYCLFVEYFYLSMRTSTFQSRFVYIICVQERRGLPPQTATSSIVADILDRTTYFTDASG